MEITELQIGDFVFYHGEFRKVVKIDGILDLLDLENERIPVPIDCVAPIVLTVEILEKNGAFTHGFAEYSLGGMHIKAQYDYEDVFQNSFIVKDILIEYVHTLQHALRLYGLNELADNIQI